jgi:8-oxo-dGTP pyrophosphatase MutT (NUDIX family)
VQRVQQAGAIAVRLDGPEPLFLVVTARRNPQEWIFPKGHLEPGEAPVDAAVRELREEAGVAGAPLGPVGSARFRSGAEEVDVTYFLIQASGPGEPREGRRLAWLPHAGARARLWFPNARDLLDQAHAQLTAR